MCLSGNGRYEAINFKNPDYPSAASSLCCAKRNLSGESPPFIRRASRIIFTPAARPPRISRVLPSRYSLSLSFFASPYHRQYSVTNFTGRKTGFQSIVYPAVFSLGIVARVSTLFNRQSFSGRDIILITIATSMSQMLMLSRAKRACTVKRGAGR